jgi:hypothetical protein
MSTVLVITLAVMPLDLSPPAQEHGAISLRGGFMDSRVGEHMDEYLSVYEASLTWMLPWQWQPCSWVRVRTGLELSAGLISGGSETAFMGSLGPAVSFRSPGETLSMDLGISTTYIDRNRFGEVDFGGPFQFSSHVGLYLVLWKRGRMGYRFQHMSDAGIYHENPGLNMHMFEIGTLY